MKHRDHHPHFNKQWGILLDCVIDVSESGGNVTEPKADHFDRVVGVAVLVVT